MRSLLAALLILAAGCQPSAPAVSGESDTRPIGEILAESGLAAADAALAARTQSPETSFQLGGVRFLRAFETMLQTRYASYDGDVGFLPGMRTPLPHNRAARFDPAFLETALTGALTHLKGAEAALAPAVNGEFATSLPLQAVWLDVDRNGERADWESLDVLLAGMGAAADWTRSDGTIRFDTADAEWLAAYVHMLSGMSELVLSLDPTPAIRTVYEGRVQLERAGPLSPDPLFGTDDVIDQIAAVLMTLEGKPDATRTRSALAHFQKMIAHNRKFWPEMMAESDNDHEWLPNPSQTSPFGVAITSEVASSWQEVLSEIDDMLAGRTLVPYWRTPYGFNPGERGVGVNMRRLLSDPGDMNLVLLIQGAAVAPYLETGKLATMDAWNRFAAMTQSDGLLIALLLN
jgi:hypothetical protein